MLKKGILSAFCVTLSTEEVWKAVPKTAAQLLRGAASSENGFPEGFGLLMETTWDDFQCKPQKVF